MAEKEQKQINIKENLSSTVLQVTKVLTFMAEEHAKAIQEVRLCHALIKEQSEKLEKYEKEGTAGLPKAG